VPFLSRAQAAGSWSKTACCAVSANTCGFFGQDYCVDNTAASDFIFRLQPGEPQFFLPTGTGSYRTRYQYVGPGYWPMWGGGGFKGDLNMGLNYNDPLGEYGRCYQGNTYAGSPNEICGGEGNWGATQLEVWRPACTTCGGHGACDASTRVCACDAGYALANPATCVRA
jgi:hypothetical protein